MSLKNQKTREVLIEASRELFAKQGKNTVTMNRIALASGKGRRTLYSYFKSKDEIYKAVLETELDLWLAKLIAVSEKELDPESKLCHYVIAHLDGAKEAVLRNGSLRADFFHDIYEVERSRRKIDLKEINLISQILKEGIKTAVFKTMDNVGLSATIILYSLKGFEIPYIRLVANNEFEKNRKMIVDFILSAIKVK